jgi:hypothetical protein
MKVEASKIDYVVFKDNETQKSFSSNGYVIVPFFSSGELEKVREITTQLNGNFSTPFSTTIWSSNAEYRQAVFTKLKAFYLPNIERLLAEYKPVMGTILTKQPGPDSEIDIHQDWCFTREENFTAVNIWVPLVDVNEQNGALFFLPFSKHFNVPYRGRNVEPQFINVKPLIWSRGKVCNMKAGEALVFDVRMVHYSNQNTTAHTRVATAMVAIPKQADIIHYINYNPERNVVTELKVDELFYNTYAHNDTIPLSPSFTTLELDRIQFNKETFENEYRRICQMNTNE